jgi:hypothetical protein
MNISSTLKYLVTLSLVGGFVAAVSCAASPIDQGSTSSSSTAGGGSQGGSGGIGGDGGVGGIFNPQGSGGQGAGGFAECESLTVVGEKVPLDLVIVQDRSGSMTTNAKWDAAVNAIKAFADNAGAAGLGVGLTYFPPKLGDECTPATYAPLDVDIAPLPGNAYDIKASLLSTSPSGGTPMRPALQGGIVALQTWLIANPSHEGIIVLVTDGDPSSCTNNTVSAIATVAQDALNATPSVRTFVVGMDGATFGNLDQIATAGGTKSAFNVGSGTSAFVAALEKIRLQAISCEYVLPVPDPTEGTLDFESVKVEFVPGLNEPAQDIKKVAAPISCGEISGGFYYDNAVPPSRIILCPASCDLVRSGTENAEVRVVLGCIMPPPD